MTLRRDSAGVRGLRGWPARDLAAGREVVTSRRLALEARS